MVYLVTIHRWHSQNWATNGPVGFFALIVPGVLSIWVQLKLVDYIVSQLLEFKFENFGRRLRNFLRYVFRRLRKGCWHRILRGHRIDVPFFYLLLGNRKYYSSVFSLYYGFLFYRWLHFKSFNFSTIHSSKRVTSDRSSYFYLYWL